MHPSNVVALTHAPPPGQPSTLGGASRLYPSYVNLMVSGVGSVYYTLNYLSVPTIISTGDFTGIARDYGAQDIWARSNSRNATLIS